jgi:hypothetical protein
LNASEKLERTRGVPGGSCKAYEAVVGVLVWT